MLRLIWIFRFAVGRCFAGRKLMVGGMVLSAKTSLKFANVAAELEFEGVSEDFVRQYFGLNDDLAQISRCIAKDDYIRVALAKV